MLKKLFSHTAIYGLAPHISKIASIFILPIITKDLTATDFGVNGIVIAFISAFAVLSTLGLRLILVNTFYKSPGQYKWAWRQLYGFLTIWNLIYGLVLAVVIYFVVPDAARENTYMIIFLSVFPVVFFGPTSHICSTYFQLKQKPLGVGVRVALSGLLTIFLNLYTISYLKMGYMGWFWSSFIAGVLSNLSYWIPLNRSIGITPIFNFKRRFIRNSLRIALPVIPHYYSSYLLNTSDRVLMKFFNVSIPDIGKYNVAYTFGNHLQTLSTASGLAVGPLLNERYRAGDDRGARNIIFLLQAVFLCGTFILALWMKEIFAFLIRNEELSQMYHLGVIIVMAYSYRPMYLGANSKLFYAEKTKILWKVTFAAGILSVLLNVLLIPLAGYAAAAYVTFVSLMFMGYAGFFLKVFKQINNARFYPLRWLSLTILLTALAAFAIEAGWAWKVLITFILSLFAFVLWRKYRKTFDRYG
ncbi:O-antigen/teichoic acid export membrane protein [Anseongella ginsenosidimutans]|uniref:O-antigen/teichoic acid export membrane protein n=1 Tax=Anseongella ginsenosidimutans TaxID=496056 RepID=A0A4R3KNW8_9SPHI|nr:oligosaccharide flippase family protein [Anseongella ginsenosidimutans]QEC52109.1 oligosaccharide flippase family protein [Anseongella ginsenosidimutans]TCS84863.1 O-antigen/teichoic acid export membrane protein [Anseongella ginsenosidimutans]